MNSTITIYIMLAFYAVIAAQSAFEGWRGDIPKWWRCLYFLAAIQISVAVLKMTEK
jgi:hypothetical protein